MRRLGFALAVSLLVILLGAAPALADYGFKRLGLSFTDQAGIAVTQAGSHPFATTTSIAINSHDTSEGTVPDGETKDLRIELPAGFVGNPTAIPPCTGAEFDEIDVLKSLPGCSNSSVVGIAALKLEYKAVPPGETDELHVPVYNLVPPRGTVAELGFVGLNVPVFVQLNVNRSFPYNVIASIENLPQSVLFFSSDVTAWGNPAASIHDAVRGNCLEAGKPGQAPISVGKCPVSIPETPFITAPRSCGGPLVTAFDGDTWSDPGAFVPGTSTTAAMTGCGALGFAPQVSSQPTVASGETPSGLNFDLNIANPGLTEPESLSDSEIEKAVVTLPEGVTTNPSVASGLGACTLAEYEGESLGGEGGCPGSSKIGTVEVETPLLEDEARDGGLRVLHGSIYVARQGDNPFGNLLTIYMVIEDPDLGIFIKLAGKVDPNPATGQLTTTFVGLPQLPFSHFHLHFREGPRAPLITPPTCGQFSTLAALYPYSNPAAPLQRTATFTIGSGAGGGACASSLGQLPFAPAFSAGTLSPAAGAYSPFVLHLNRPDGSQQFSSVAATLPPGLLGRLAGIPYCSDAQVAQAVNRSAEGQGAAEIAAPSCPSGSEVGTVSVGAGAGTEPYYVSGHAYLAGSYKGAPLSLVIVTPAIAGPFDLGVVAIRTALYVNLETAQITAVSDPIPPILHGLPLDVRSIAVDMARPGFTLNPTSCEPMAVAGSATSTLGATASLSDRFQVSGCAKLGFKPKLALRLTGATKRAGHPSLRAVVSYPKKGSYSNIARAQVSLPHSEFLDQSNIGTVCTQPQLKSATCPKKSIYGFARAWSPLLEKPLEGPVYLGVGYGHKLPDLVADLNGQIRILLHGRVDTAKSKGIRNTFEVVPDAPVSRFVLTLKGGKRKGLLVNSENICLKSQRASARFVAQSGRAVQLRPQIANDCKGRQKS
jgi:hypothetical protein